MDQPEPYVFIILRDIKKQHDATNGVKHTDKRLG